MAVGVTGWAVEGSVNLATSPGRDSQPELIRPGAGGGLGAPSKSSSRLDVWGMK